MEFRILGPLEVIEDNGELLLLPGPRQRSLLALLALHANEVVSSTGWSTSSGPRRPRGAGAAALQASVSRLRKALGHTASCSSRRRPATPSGSGPTSSTSTASSVSSRRQRTPSPGGCGEAPRGARALARLRARRLRVRAVRAGGDQPARGVAPARAREADRAPTSSSGGTPSSSPSSSRWSPSYPLREGLREQADAGPLPRGSPGRRAGQLSERQARRSWTSWASSRARRSRRWRGRSCSRMHRSTSHRDGSVDALDPRRGYRCDSAPSRCWRLRSPLRAEAAREVIVACLVADRGGLATAAAEVDRARAMGSAGAVASARAAVFTSDSPGADTSRLATEQDVDLVLVAATPALLDDRELTSCCAPLRATSPCSSAPRRHQARCSSRSPAPSTTGARSSSAHGSPAAGRCRYASPGRPSRAAGTRADCWRARPSLFSGRWVWRPSRSWSSRARTRSSLPLAEAAVDRRRPVRPLAEGGSRPDPGALAGERPARRCSCARDCGRAVSRPRRT